MPGTTYIEVEIAVGPGSLDELIGLLSLSGFEGFWEEESHLRAYIKSPLWDDIRRKDLEDLVARQARRQNLPPPEISVRRVEDRNWNALWEASVQPVQVSDRIIVAPTWHPFNPAPGQLVLTIDPKMSFGTGHHETTRLMVQLIETHLREGDRMLDVGTGTGILAIAAVKLGAASATGVDNDQWSYDNARENVRLNGVEQRVTLMLGEIGDVQESGFDLIAANIQRGVIEQILPAMRKRLAPGGRILLSGLLETDGTPILSALDALGLRILDQRRDKEWLAIAAT